LSDQKPGDKGGDIVGVEFAKIANEKPTHANAHALTDAIRGTEEVIQRGSRNVWKRLRKSTEEAWIVVVIQIGGWMIMDRACIASRFLSPFL
jgi:hypothetical protein